MFSSISSQNGSLSSYYNRVEQANKIEVPLPSSISVYAQFKYVRGVPASSNQEPVSLARAQIIDNMVSYLNNSPDELSLNSSNEEFSVRELEQEVHRVVNEDQPSFSSLPGTGSDIGLIFNLTA